MLIPHLHVPSGNMFKGHHFTFILSALNFKELSFVWIYFRGMCVLLLASIPPFFPPFYLSFPKTSFPKQMNDTYMLFKYNSKIQLLLSTRKFFLVI